MPEETGEITKLLQLWRQGSADAENELFERVNIDLRRIAHYLMSGERKGHSLQATELVDQVYFRLAQAKNCDWRDRQHFFAIASRAMRRHLIDLWRKKRGLQFVGLPEVEALLPAGSAKLGFLVTVDKLLDQLTEHQPDWCTLVELKYFLGMSDEEAAEAMGIKLRTMQRMWKDARQWLYRQLEYGNADNPAEELPKRRANAPV